MSSKFHKEKRSRIRATVTRIVNDQGNYEEYDLAKAMSCKLKLEKADEDLSYLDEEIHNLVADKCGVTLR